MKKTLLIPLVLFSISLYAQDTIYFNSNWKETNKSDAKYYRTISKLDSLWKIEDYFINDRLQMSGMLNKPIKTARHGRFTWYNESGTVVQQADYRNGKKNGVTITNYDNGKPKAIENYLNGIFHGLMKSYHPNGKLESSGEYVNGNLHGILEFWFPDGQLKIHSEFDHGKKIGEWEYYDETGKLNYNPSYNSHYEIIENQLYFDIPNKEWFGNKFIKKNNISWHSFQRTPVQNESGLEILPNISFLVEETGDLNDVVLYSIQKRGQMPFEIDSTFIHEHGKCKLQNAIAYLGHTAYPDGSKHTVVVVHALVDKKGVQIVMDITSDLYAKYGKEFWLALERVHLKE